MKKILSVSLGSASRDHTTRHEFPGAGVRVISSKAQALTLKRPSPCTANTMAKSMRLASVA